MAAVDEIGRQFSQKEGALISRKALFIAGYCALVVMTAYSAVVVKESRQALPLIAVQSLSVTQDIPEEVEPLPLAPGEVGPPVHVPKALHQKSVEEVTRAMPTIVLPVKSQPLATYVPVSTSGLTPQTRWFNGRPVRPAHTVTMLVTGYSPDARSCGTSADGLTATMHSVETNAFRLVAADPTVLPYGSMVTVPGYASDLIVPVLDCGGLIKGNHIDLLFRTHEEAIKWGARHVNVVIWEYADGEPRDNPRALR